MSKGGGKQTTNTVAEPWSGVQDYLKKGYASLDSIYNKGAPGYYPGQTVAPMNGYTEGALDSLAQRGAQGSAVVGAAKGALTDTLQGGYLNANPHLQGAIDSAIRPITENYQDVVLPGLDSQFSMAGRYGGNNTRQQANTQAGQDYMRQIGDVSSGMSYQNYGDERQRMMQAGALAPALAQQDYTDINAMGQAGQGFSDFNQSLINSDINKYNYNQNKDYNFASDYLGLLNGAIGGSQTTTAPGQNPSIFGGALSGGLAGAGLGNLFPGIGTGIGALGGAGLGILGSLF